MECQVLSSILTSETEKGFNYIARCFSLPLSTEITYCDYAFSVLSVGFIRIV